MKHINFSILLIIFSLVLSSYSHAATPFVEGSIILKNGDQKDGLIQFATLTPVSAKSINFKALEKDKEEKITSTQIEYILIGDKDNPHVMRYLKTKRYTMKGGEKEMGKMGWCFVYDGCKKLQILKSIPFEINNKGTLLFLYDRTMMQEDYYAIRSNETVAIFLGSIFNEKRLGVGGSKVNRKVMVRYFKNDKALVSKIEKQKWDLLKIGQIVDHVCSDAPVDKE